VRAALAFDDDDDDDDLTDLSVAVVVVAVFKQTVLLVEVGPDR